MSFYSYRNSCNEQCPGRIHGDGAHGLTERVCIQVRKVYDSCMQQEQLENEAITLTDVEGEYTAPLTYVSGKSTCTQGTVTDLTITRLSDRPHCARVTATVNIPIVVTFTDAEGRTGTGNAVISVKKDVILSVPDESVIPYCVDTITSASGVRGTFVTGFSFLIDICITVILKIVADVELLIPSYGFCRIPPCEEFSTEICDAFFDLPIFPVQSFADEEC